MDERPRLLESFRNPILLLALLAGCATVLVALAQSGLSEFGPFKLFTHTELLQAEGRGWESAEMWLDLATCALCLWLMIKLPGRRLFFALYGGFFFLLAMEESDWLQQVLGYPSPHYFAEHNKFGAVNIHNLLLFGEHSSVPIGQYWALAFMLAPLGLFLLYSLWRAWGGDFLGKVVLLLFGFAFVAECIPMQPVFQILLALFGLAYAGIAASVETERRRPAAGDGS